MSPICVLDGEPVHLLDCGRMAVQQPFGLLVYDQDTRDRGAAPHVCHCECTMFGIVVQICWEATNFVEPKESHAKALKVLTTGCRKDYSDFACALPVAGFSTLNPQAQFPRACVVYR
jgi:hypothetical protein